MAEFTNPFKGQILAEPVEPNRIRRFKQRSRRGILYAFLAVAALAAVAGLFAKPVYRLGKEWRAGGLMKEAEREFAKENWAGAMRAAHAAFLLAPANMENLRLVSKIFNRLNSPRALEILGRIVAVEGKEEDRRTLIEMALRFEQLEVAQSHADVLLQGNSKSRDNLLVAAQVARASSDLTRELSLLQSARELFPENDEIAFKNARVLLQLGSEVQVAEALSAIRRMAERSDLIGLSALEVVAYRATHGDVPALIEKLRQHPLAIMRHLILAADLEFRAALSSSKAVGDRVVGSAEGRSLEEIAIAAGWLAKQKQYDQLLKLVPRERALASEELALMHLDALFGLQQWEEIRTLLARPGLLTHPGIKNFYQWQLEQMEAGRARSDKEARLAMDAAFDFAPSLAFMGARFEELGRADLALVAFSRLHSTGNFEKLAGEALFRIAFRNGDTQGALKLFEEQLRQRPNDPWVQNNVAYFHLLLNRPLEASLRTSRRLVDNYPDRIAYRATLALAQLRAGNFPEALRMFPRGEFEWKRALPSTRAVYVATLRANGQVEAAAEIEAALARTTMFPEERALLTENITGMLRKP